MPLSCSPTRYALFTLGLLLGSATVAEACPTDATPRAATTLLSVGAPGGIETRAFGASELADLPTATLTQRQTVTAGPGVRRSERSVTYSGPLLRDVLLRAGFGLPNDRAARVAIVELVATDGYRAVFSWGELFNAPLGDEVVVVTAQDGHPLDAHSGPLALRSLADLRPGPRHVRNLCGVIVRRSIGG
jgi:hypothetical protein